VVGQLFRANKTGAYTVLRQSQAAPAPSLAGPVAGLPRHEPAASPSENAAVPERPAGPSPSKRPSCDFAGPVSKGQFEETLSRAQRLGFETALAECPPRGLFALADAARYLGKYDLAKKTLLAIGKRSPEDSSKAAFFLGRLEEARENLELALDYYRRAVEGDPEPHFAQEARAGAVRIGKRMRSRDSHPDRNAP
jgi:tetratricopeptide (TPR) repeat protein